MSIKKKKNINDETLIFRLTNDGKKLGHNC